MVFPGFSKFAVLASLVAPAFSAPGAIDGKNVGTYATPQYIVSPPAIAVFALPLLIIFATDFQLSSLAESDRIRQHRCHPRPTVRQRLLFRRRIQPSRLLCRAIRIHERIFPL